MDLPTHTLKDDIMVLRAEAEHLCALHQDVRREALRLLDDFRSVCAEARERLEQARRRQAAREGQDAPSGTTALGPGCTCHGQGPGPSGTAAA